jgi:hypothetical protein
MTDPLAQFRKVATEPQAAAGDAEPLEYVAFDGKDGAFRMVIECGPDKEHAPLYQYLLDVGSDGRHGTYVILAYTFMMVHIRGRNLGPMVTAIRGHYATVIRKFGKSWIEPKDSSLPFIEEIEITMPDRERPSAQGKKKQRDAEGV